MIDSRSQTRTHSRNTQLRKKLSVYQGLPLDTDEAGSSTIKHKEDSMSNVKWNVGDKVIAPAPHGHAPIPGFIDRIWINKYGVEMASVNYGNTDKVDWMMDWHVHVTTKHLKAWEE